MWCRILQGFILNILKGTMLLENLVLSYGGAKDGQTVNFEIFLNLKSFKVVRRICHIKTVFECKNGLLNCYCSPYFAKYPKRFLSKSTFHRSFMSSSMKLPHLENSMSYLKNKNNAPKLSWKCSPLQENEKSILSFWPNWSISMCWVKYTCSMCEVDPTYIWMVVTLEGICTEWVKKTFTLTKMFVTYNLLRFQPCCFLCRWANIMTTHSCKNADLWLIIRKWQLLL